MSFDLSFNYSAYIDHKLTGEFEYNDTTGELYFVSEGNIVVWDVSAQKVTHTYELGTQLGGIDISSDGKLLYVAEQELASFTDTGSWPDDRGEAVIYKINLSTRETSAVKFEVKGSERGTSDVGVTSSGKIFATTNFSGSGWNPLHYFETTNESVRDYKGNPNFLWDEVRQSSDLITSSNNKYMLLLENNSSGGYIHLFDADQNKYIAHTDSFEADMVGHSFNFGKAAISEASELTVSVGYNSFLVMNLQLDVVKNLNEYQLAGRITGVSFSEDGAKLYAIDNDSHKILVFNTTTWEVADTPPLVNPETETLLTTSYNDTNVMEISKDGRFLFIEHEHSERVIIIDLEFYGEKTFNGTDGADTFSARIGADHFEGGKGQDTVDYSNVKQTGISVNFLDTTSTSGYAFGDTFNSVETLIASNFNDTIVGSGRAETFIAQSGDDFVLAGAGHDSIWAGTQDNGDDTLAGNDGNDVIGGGNGHDLLVGGDIGEAPLSELSGSDVIFGGAGNDRIVGGAYNTNLAKVYYTQEGRNFLWGGSGHDTIYGDNSNDVIGGGGHNDTIFAAGGHDVLYGGQGIHGGNDRLEGGYGNDTIYASIGDDRLIGGNGDDVLYAGEGNDIVDGGKDRDEIWGGPGNDTLIGGGGSDTFAFSTDFGADTITDFESGDQLDLSSIEGISLDELLGAAVTTGGDSTLSVGDHGSIFLEGVNETELQAIFDNGQVLVG